MIKDAVAINPKIPQQQFDDTGPSPSAGQRSAYVESIALMVKPKGIVNPAVLSAAVQ